MHIANRFRGSMLGLAVGDALGAAVEFMPPGSFKPVSDMTGGGPHRLRPGQWTDDTSMALCLAASLIEKREFDPKDQMERYVRWYRKGYLSSTGTFFDIGNTTRLALERFERTGEPYSGPTRSDYAGNGSLMRLAPVPLAFAFHPMAAISRAADSSRTTHGAMAAIDACRYMAGLIVGAVSGAAKEELLSPMYEPRSLTGLWQREPLVPAVAEVASGSFKAKSPPAIRGTGYVVSSLEAALWALHVTDSFEAGCLAAVNLGDDADTTAAIHGQLAGAIYGADAIPKAWVEVLAMRDDIVRVADGLLALSGSEGSSETALADGGAWIRAGELMPVSNQAVPFNRSYWVVPGKLLAGNYPGAAKEGEARAKLTGLVDAGIRTVVNLMEEGETHQDGHPVVPYEPILHTVAEGRGRQVSVLRIPIRDVNVPRPGVMRDILDHIVSSVVAGRPVYVHCRGGLGRTGTVVGCYMLEQGLATRSTVLDQIRALRSNLPYPHNEQTSPETAAQRKFVLDWLKDPH